MVSLRVGVPSAAGGVFVAAVLGLLIGPKPPALHGQLVASEEVVERPIYFKLPLTQPRFHFRFHEPHKYLSGRLTLTIRRGDEPQVITVFEDGAIRDGWDVIQAREAHGMYFGFQSAARYLTSPDDRVDIEFIAPEALVGLGPELMGLLYPGTYRSTGKFKHLLGATSDSPDANALLSCWDETWDLDKVGDGSLPADEVARQAAEEAQHREQTEALLSMAEALGAREIPNFDAAADGSPCT